LTGAGGVVNGIEEADATTSSKTAAETSVEAHGTTVEEAVSKALSQLGITRDEAEVEVVSSGSRPVPGERLSGMEARVRVYRIDDHAARARALLEELLTRMEVPCRVTVRRGGASSPSSPAPAPVILDISGDDLGLLIGWRGETLRALQTALNLMLGDEDGADGRRIILDVERYRARREDQVRELAIRLAARVKRTGEQYTLDPMHAYERRVIHLTLADDPGVRTESSGKEPARRVVINPTGPAQGGPPDRFSDRPRRGPSFGRRY
jgi:spoIIIJ-associated protein